MRDPGHRDKRDRDDPRQQQQVAARAGARLRPREAGPGEYEERRRARRRPEVKGHRQRERHAGAPQRAGSAQGAKRREQVERHAQRGERVVLDVAEEQLGIPLGDERHGDQHDEAARRRGGFARTADAREFLRDRDGDGHEHHARQATRERRRSPRGLHRRQRPRGVRRRHATHQRGDHRRQRLERMERDAAGRLREDRESIAEQRVAGAEQPEHDARAEGQRDGSPRGKRRRGGGRVPRRGSSRERRQRQANRERGRGCRQRDPRPERVDVHAPRPATRVEKRRHVRRHPHHDERSGKPRRRDIATGSGLRRERRTDRASHADADRSRALPRSL